MPAAVAIPAIMGAAGIGANLYGASKSAGAAKSAAATQLAAGIAAATNAQAAAREAETGLAAQTGAGQSTVTSAANQAAQAIRDASASGQDILTGQYYAALDRLSPYATAGNVGISQLAAGLAPGGDLNKQFTMADYQEDPGYQFRLQQGQLALDRAASAKGQVLGGAQLKAINRYNSGMASQEYQNAYNRFIQQQQLRTQNLFNLSGIGQNATNQANQLGSWYGGTTLSNLMNTANLAENYTNNAAQLAANMGISSANTIGNWGLTGAQLVNQALTGGANAQAAGTVGAANAWNSGIGGALNSGLNAVLLSQIMKGQPPINYGGVQNVPFGPPSIGPYIPMPTGTP